MDDAIKRELDDILAAFEAKRSATIETAANAQDARRKFLEGFAGKLTSVVRPAMDGFKRRLQEYRMGFEVEELKSGRRKEGEAPEPGGLRLTIYPDGPSDPRHPGRRISMEVKPDSPRNLVMVDDGGKKPTEYELDELDAATVERHVLAMLSRALR
jgi:hypothetical protein